MAVAAVAVARIAGRDKIRQLKPWLAPYVLDVLDYLARYGIGGTVFDVYRSPQEQDRRFRLGDSKARGGESPHQYGLAFDFVVSQGEQSPLQRDLQRFWNGLGFAIIDWDPAHVEYPDWRQFQRS